MSEDFTPIFDTSVSEGCHRAALFSELSGVPRAKEISTLHSPLCLLAQLFLKALLVLQYPQVHILKNFPHFLIVLREKVI